MESYFVRHTKGVSVRDEDLEYLWSQHKVAIHYPVYVEGIGSADNESLNPEDYPGRPDSWAKTSVRTLSDLATSGGYVWAESRVDGRAKVGLVTPQKVEPYRARWTFQPRPPVPGRNRSYSQDGADRRRHGKAGGDWRGNRASRRTAPTGYDM